MLEQTHVVKSLRRILPPEGKRVETIVQFWAVEGGMRTVTVKDIVDIS